MAEEKNILTAEGYRKYQEELSDLKTTKAAEITQRLAEARAQGDLSENSEYDDAKDAQARNEARIKEIEAILKNSEVQDDDDISTKEIVFGSTFTLRDEETKESASYQLVGPTEEDIFSNKLSKDSPLGMALLGKKKNQVVEVTTNAGAFKYKVMKIGK